MDQSLEGQIHSIAEVWIKNEPIDVESTAYLHIKCEENIDIVETDPSTETMSIKSEITEELTHGDYVASSESLTKGQTAKNQKPKQKLNDIDKKFHCEDCVAKFARGDHLEAHRRRHNGERPFNCEECGESFQSLYCFKGHQQRKHRGEAPYRCDECGKKFFRKDVLAKHKLFHSVDRPFPCDICGLRFTRNCHVKSHLLKHTGEQPFSCDECGMKFMYSSRLKHHRKIHTRERPSTSVVTSSREKKCPETVNIEFENTFNDYECIPKSENITLQLTKIDEQKQAVNAIDKKVHSETQQQRTFPGNECDRSTINPSIINSEPPTEIVSFATGTVSIKSEITDEITLGDYECIPSSESLRNQQTKKIEKQKPIRNAIDKKFYCECGSKFSRRDQLEVHQRRHTGERPFGCDECGKRFFRKAILTKHKRFHSGEKPYACDICGMRFAQSGHVKPHKQTHTDARPFTCDECGSKFAYKNGLKTHKKLHSNETIFCCNICKIKFDRKDFLERHTREKHS